MTEKSDKITTESLAENNTGGALQKRALVTTLANQLKQVPDGKAESVEEIIAKMVTDVVLTGEVQLLPTRKGERAPIMVFSPKDWMETVKWIFDRVEGKPVQAVDASVKSSIFFDGLDTMIMDEEQDDRNSEMVGDDELHSETERMSKNTKE